jgi:hypothetical protein
MAHPIVRPQDRSHAGQFLTSLSQNQRNALRVLLMQNTGLADLREARPRHRAENCSCPRRDDGQIV